jgi:hypothetical protein
MNNALETVFKRAFERFTGFLSVIQSDHAYIHQGIGFMYNGTTSSLSASSSTSIEFTTPTNKYIHYRPTMMTSSANYLTASLKEASTTTGGSSVLSSILNRNRISTTASTMQTLKTGVTVSVAGTEIDFMATGVNGGGSSEFGGSTGSEQEIILKQNTKYTITFTNSGTVTATIGTYQLFWYEEETGV